MLMQNRSVLICGLTALLSLTFLAAPARADSFTIEVITTFDYPGATRTQPTAINDSNEISGFFSGNARSRTSGFTRTADGQFSAPIIDPADVNNLTAAFGINNSGTVCGYFFGADDYHGFFFSSGAYTQYDVPGSSGTVVLGLNNAGDFAGYYYTPQNIVKGFTNVDGTVTTIDFAAGISIQPHQINAAHQIVGSYADSTTGFGFGFYSTRAGELQYPISAPGATNTYLNGINDRGWMVGQYFDRNRLGHGLFFRPPDQFVTFDYAGSPSVSLTGINRRGFICGYYSDGNNFHGLLARVRRTAN